MPLELFPFVILNNVMAFVYAYTQCLDGPVNWFSLTTLCLDTSLLLLTVTLQEVSNKHCLLPLFSFYSGQFSKILLHTFLFP